LLFLDGIERLQNGILQLVQWHVYNIQSRASLGAFPAVKPIEISGKHGVLFPYCKSIRFTTTYGVQRQKKICNQTNLDKPNA
jgi:hypothetical protein